MQTPEKTHMYGWHDQESRQALKGQNPSCYFLNAGSKQVTIYEPPLSHL